MAAGVGAAGAEPRVLPVADGGDGTLDVLLATASGGWVEHHEVHGPDGQPLPARLGWLDPQTAVVEMAEAAGLRLVQGDRLDALGATSRGTGELIAAALDGGATRIIVGVGGGASTDGGAGILQALGARLGDADGRDIQPGGAALLDLDRIDLIGLDRRLRVVRIRVAVDVRNPLLGPDGAARVFAPQKGAGPEDVEVLEQALSHFVEVVERDLGKRPLADLPGAGAAGGCGFGLALIGAGLLPGAKLICDLVGLDAALEGADLVLTGEGRLDSQTAAGKAPAEVAERAHRRGIPCIAIAGSVDDPPKGMFQSIWSLTDLANGSDPHTNAAELIREAARLAASKRG